MRIDRILLVLVGVLVVKCFGLSVANKISYSPDNIYTGKGRRLRTRTTAKETNDEDNDIENRGRIPLSSLEQAVSIATSKLNTDISSAAMSIKLKLWAKQKKSIDDVKKLLGIGTSSGKTLKDSLNEKFLDEFATAQISRWAKKDLSLSDVKVRLGLDKLSEFDIKSNSNFKYYEKYVEKQIPVWVKKEVSPNDVWVKFGLDKLASQASVIESTPSYKLYNKFMTSDLESWAMNMQSRETVLEKLGLQNLKGKALKSHRNYVYYEKYVRSENSYRLSGWLKQDFSTFDVWTALKLGTIPLAQRENSQQYKIYSSYVQTLDDAMSNGQRVPHAISKRTTPEEMTAKINVWWSTERNAGFVMYALGLDQLEGAALTSHKNYKYFEQFVRGY